MQEILIVALLLKVEVVMTFLDQRLFTFVKHSVQLPSFNICFCFLGTLLFLMEKPQIMSF